MKNYSFKLRGKGRFGPVIVFHLNDARFTGRRFMYSTGHHIQPGEWSKSRQRPKDDKKLSEHLDLIVKLVKEYLADRFSSKTISRGDLKNWILQNLKDERTEPDPEFSKLWTSIIETTKTTKGHTVKKSTYLQKQQTQRTVELYAKERNITLTFQSLTIRFYHDFDAWMIEKKMSGNTRGKHMKEIKAVLREALERDIPVSMDFQKKSWRVIKDSVDRVYLTTDELKKWVNKDLPPFQARNRDIFIMACFTGARHSDWSQIKKENIIKQDKTEILRYKQTKTGDLVHVPLHPVVKMILNKYPENPKVLSNQKFNDSLKDIAELMEMGDKAKLITTHTARRSFATNAYLSKSLDIQQIMKCTGHKTEETFKAYLKLDGLDYAQLASESKFFTEDWTLLKIAN
jgi:integrase